MTALNIFSAANPEGRRIDVGRALGSEATFMYLYDLPPGKSSSPYHYEYGEEWLLVVDGAVVFARPTESVLWSAEISSVSSPVPPGRTRS